MVKEVTRYITRDEKEFNSESKAVDYCEDQIGYMLDILLARHNIPTPNKFALEMLKDFKSTRTTITELYWWFEDHYTLEGEEDA